MANLSKTIRSFLSKKWKFTRGEGGFTLIELLVAMTIISMLIAASFSANYIKSLQRGRDARRKGDLKRIQQVFEQYYGEKQLYGTCDTMRDAGYLSSNAFPTDPRGASYNGLADANCTTASYCVCADLEQDGQGNAYDNNCRWTTADPEEERNFFCVSNLQ